MHNWDSCWDGIAGCPVLYRYRDTSVLQALKRCNCINKSCFGNNLVIDPTAEEEACQDGSLMISCMPARYEVTQLTLTGEWSTAKINEAMELCLDACSKLANIMRSCLKEIAS